MSQNQKVSGMCTDYGGTVVVAQVVEDQSIVLKDLGSVTFPSRVVLHLFT